MLSFLRSPQFIWNYQEKYISTSTIYTTYILKRLNEKNKTKKNPYQVLSKLYKSKQNLMEDINT